MDELMRDLAGRRPVVTDRSVVDPVAGQRTRLRTHYRRRRERYDVRAAAVHDHDVRRLFSDDPRHRDRTPAAAFLRRLRAELRERVARWTGQHAYTVDQVLAQMIARCQALGLRCARPARELRLDALALVTASTRTSCSCARSAVTTSNSIFTSWRRCGSRSSSVAGGSWPSGTSASTRQRFTA